MSDIFNEVDEELRREQLKKLWERYGILIIALAVLFVAAVGGWRGYQWWEAKKAAEAGAAFEAAAIAQPSRASTRRPRRPSPRSPPTAPRATACSPSCARRPRSRSRDPKAAVAIYDALAADRSLDQMQRDLAALRAGLLLVDTASYDELKTPARAADRRRPAVPAQRAQPARARGVARQQRRRDAPLDRHGAGRSAKRRPARAARSRC